jgi:hypothetical protein
MRPQLRHASLPSAYPKTGPPLGVTRSHSTGQTLALRLDVPSQLGAARGNHCFNV